MVVGVEIQLIGYESKSSHARPDLGFESKKLTQIRRAGWAGRDCKEAGLSLR